LIVAFSCSSPVCSVAVLAVDGAILFSELEVTRHNAGGACLRMLEIGLKRLGMRLEETSLFAADLGPGSFIGVRVGVTLAKTLAFATSKLCIGASSFDLITADRTVVMPSKKAEFFVRIPNAEVFRTDKLPEPADFVGYGSGIEEPVYPNAARFASLLQRLPPMAPELLIPQYMIEPSISTPRKPYIPRATLDG